MFSPSDLAVKNYVYFSSVIPNFWIKMIQYLSKKNLKYRCLFFKQRAQFQTLVALRLFLTQNLITRHIVMVLEFHTSYFLRVTRDKLNVHYNFMI